MGGWAAVGLQCNFYLCDLFSEVTKGILEVLSLCSKSEVGLTMSCKSEGGLAKTFLSLA